jgi:hypothetical protein
MGMRQIINQTSKIDDLLDGSAVIEDKTDNDSKQDLIKTATEQWTLIVLEHLAHKQGLDLTGYQSTLVKANSNSILVKRNEKVENINQNNI